MMFRLVCLRTILLRASHVCKCNAIVINQKVLRTNHLMARLSLSGKARACSASAFVTSTIADHTTSVADTIKSSHQNYQYTYQASKKKMSFEPKTKVELDPPKDDVISLDYLSKCDGKLHLARIAQRPHILMSPTTGTNPDYPTYVAIKGTVFDVSGNKAYGPEGSYKGMFKHDVPHPSRSCRLTLLPRSLRWQGRFSRSRAVFSQV